MADLAEIVGAAAAGANPVTAIVGLGKDLIDRFVPDPQAKAAAQGQMQQALIDQQKQGDCRDQREHQR